jgi:inorganic pyrophosphatase
MILPPPFAEDGETINAVIETPSGSRNKFEYVSEYGLFKMGKILPEGTHFPMHFGFIPQTKAADGDPVDVLVMMEAPSYPGIWIECRMLGVVEGEQTERDGKIIRNDRLIAVPVVAKGLSDLHTIKDINQAMLKQLTSFFSYYNYMDKKKFNVLRVRGPVAGKKLIKDHLEKE